MKRRILFILLILITLGFLTHFYINNILLPVKIKNLLAQRAQTALGRPVTIGSLQYQLPKGVIITDIQIGQKDDSQINFISIPEISFNILITSFLKSKQIIIPSLKIHQPRVAVIRNPEGEFNFTDLFQTAKPIQPADYSVLIKKLKIDTAEINVKDYTLTEPFIATYMDVNVNVNLSLKKEIQYVLTAKILSEDSTIKLDGVYNLNDQSLEMVLNTINIPLTEYYPLLPVKSDIIINSGRLSTSDLKLNYSHATWRLSGAADLKNADITLPKHQQIIGDADVTFKDLYYEEDLLTMTGDLQLANSRLILSPDHILQGQFMANVHQFTWTDKHIDIFGQFYIDDAMLSWQKNQFVKGKISFLNSSLKMFESQVALETKIDAETINLHLSENQNITTQLATSQTIMNFKDHLLTLTTDLSLKDTSVQWPENISFFGQATSPSTKLTLVPGKDMNFDSQMQLTSVQLQLNDGRSFKGSPKARVNYRKNFESGAPAEFNGEINFYEGALTGIPYVNNLRALAGELTFNNNQVTIKNMRLQSQDIEFALTGKLENFSDPAIQLQAQADNINLEKLSSLFPGFKNQYKFNITGTSRLTARAAGSLSSLLNEDLLITSYLSGSTITFDNFSTPFENINGTLSVSKDLVQWDDLNLTFQNQSYNINGFLRDFSRPKVNTTIKNKDADFKAQFNILNRAIQIASLLGQYHNTTVDLKGDVHFPEKKSPKMDFRGKFDFELTDLLPLLPQYKTQFDALKPKGRFSGNGLIRGSLDDWRQWDLTFEANSPYLEIKDFNLDNLSLHYSQRDQHISQLDIYSKIYDGTLNITSSADLINDRIPFRLATKIENLNLATLRSDIQVKFKDLTGLLNFNLSLNGPLMDKKDWTGTGSLHINQGRIWQHKVIDNIWEALLIIPEFNNVIFSEAHAGFKIEKEKINSSNIVLKGNTINIAAEGWVGFDQRIHLAVHPKFSEITLAKSESLRKGPTSLISQAIEYKCHGTLSYPKCEKSATLKKTTGMIKDGVGSIFEDVIPGIFQGIKGVVEQ